MSTTLYSGLILCDLQILHFCNGRPPDSIQSAERRPTFNRFTFHSKPVYSVNQTPIFHEFHISKHFNIFPRSFLPTFFHTHILCLTCYFSHSVHLSPQTLIFHTIRFSPGTPTSKEFALCRVKKKSQQLLLNQI